MTMPFEVVKWQVWDGTLTQDQFALFARMKPVVDDMNRHDDPVLYSWYEHCQWKWKQREYAWVLSHLDLASPTGRKVLDAGCGYTPLIRYLASIGMEAYGFDLDAVEQQSNLPKSSTLLYGDLVRYHKQDIRAMKWPSDFFDYTVCVSVLEHLWFAEGLLKKAVGKLLPHQAKFFHLENLRRALSEFARVTRSGGLIILTMDCGYGGGLRVEVVEKLLGIRVPDFPDIETIRSYWEGDEYYSKQNRIYPGAPREYTAFIAVLRKVDAR